MSMKWLIPFFLVLAQSVLSQGLSSRECAEIQAIYQITPPQCGGQTQPQNATQPTRQDTESNIFFKSGGARLDPAAVSQLQQLANVLNTPDLKNACVRLVGHSDSSGSAELNLEIGYNRAVAVQNMLQSLVLDASRIEDVQSRGEATPLPHFPPDSHWQRRVEIWARTCG